MGPSSRPAVSVIVPVYNDPPGLRLTLESLLDQAYPTYEVIVVDNNSTDDTAAVGRSIARSHPDLVRLESERDVQSSYAARNTGIQAAKGEILAFIDADVTVESDWLTKGVATMQAEDVQYVGCRVEVPHEGETIVGRYNSITGFPVKQYVERNRFAPTCGLFVHSRLFVDVGTFDQSLVSGGDTEFGQRVAAAGYDLHYASEVRVEHPARTSLRSLLKKRLRIGRGITQRSIQYPDRYDPAPLAHPLGILPPHPGRFHQVVGDGWHELNWSAKIGLYGVAYLERLAETAGRALETVERKATT